MSPQPGYFFLTNRRDTRLPAAPSLTYYYTRFQILVNPPSRHCEKAQRADVAIRPPVPSSSNFLQIFSFSGLTNSPYSFTINTRKQDGGIQPRPWSDPLPCFRTVYNQTSTGNPRVLRPGVFLFFMPFHGKTCISSWLQLSPASSRAAQEENCSSSSAQVRKR